MAALKSILSSRVSKWMGHPIATIFLPRSYCMPDIFRKFQGWVLSFNRTVHWRIEHATPSLSWSQRRNQKFKLWVLNFWGKAHPSRFLCPPFSSILLHHKYTDNMFPQVFINQFQQISSINPYNIRSAIMSRPVFCRINVKKFCIRYSGVGTHSL